MTKNSNEFLENFDKKQKAQENFKNYVLKNGHSIDLIKKQEFKKLLKQEREAYDNFSDYMKRCQSKT